MSSAMASPRLGRCFSALLLTLAATWVLVELTASAAFTSPVLGRGAGTQRHSSRSFYDPSSPEVAAEVKPSASSPLRLGGAALSILAALVLTVVPMEEAQAAKGGGRIGNTAPSARKPAPARPAPPPPAAISTNKTTIINKTTVIHAPPTVIVAPPPVMGYGGYGYLPPVIFHPAPTLGDVVVGAVVGGAINNAINGGNRGSSGTDRMLENQQRQDERQLDNQTRELDKLKSDLAAMKVQSSEAARTTTTTIATTTTATR